MFANDQQRAAAFAAYKMLERMLKQDNQNIPPGYEYDLSNHKIEITFPKGTIVSRDKGTTGDGTITKTNTPKLYGYALIAALAIRLKKFNQWNTVRNHLIQAVRDAITNGNSLQEELKTQDPEFNKQLNDIRASVNAPTRTEDTPRNVYDNDQFLTINFKRNKE